VPIVIVAVLDQDLSEKVILKYPKLYIECQNDIYFNFKTFWVWVILAFYDSALAFFVALAALHHDNVFDNGQTSDLWVFSTATYTCLVITATLKLALDIKHWTIIHQITVWGSIVVYVVFMMIYNSILTTGGFLSSTGMYWIFWTTLTTPTFWFLLPMTIVICLLPDVLWKYIMRNYYPTASDIARELMRETNKDVLVTEFNSSSAIE